MCFEKINGTTFNRKIRRKMNRYSKFTSRKTKKGGKKKSWNIKKSKFFFQLHSLFTISHQTYE